MKIVIDIPDDDYKYIKLLHEGLTDYQTTLKLYRAVKNGTVERPQGEWIKGREISRTMIGDTVLHIDYKDYACSHCGYQIDTHYERGYLNYCPNCGADMRGGRND